MGAFHAGAPAAVDGAGRSGARRAAGQQLAVAMNPAHAEKLLPDRATRSPSCSRSRTGASRCRDSPAPRLGAAVASAARSRVAERRRHPARVGSGRENEFVVLSAHLDHLGVGGAVNGDKIYNGAMDNASGVAAHTRNRQRAARVRRRSRRDRSCFVAVTGEEKGELGSRYFAAHPTVPRVAPSSPT